ncbi:DEAD/DEAH box helicase [Chitinophagaceae bacterium 26-R-25]|nr:DEAD/DEAH box helicase [Chitinophagaceae bacterium 26-R-25]
MSFDLLTDPIKRYVRDKKWESFRPIQVAAIQRILGTEGNYILASRTASGKTEAAFLPILSKVNFNQEGVQVLYISPLIALINDQFYRIEELCKFLDVEVTKWHGEASKSQKNKLLTNPSGIVLITPESLEAMFVNAPFKVKTLFANLKYVVIDEIHSFIGTDRGVQLKSILSRLQKVNIDKFKLVGLSATIGDYNEAKRMTGDETNTKVLLDKSAKEMKTQFRYFENEKPELSLELLKDLYVETKDNKVLIFPNSRGRAEEIAVKLRKISERLKGHSFYFSHHSSVDKDLREYVENFAKNNRRNNFCICCTSTLELGIDIGTVDEVVQVDATHSIASLIQRVGRSGRREGEKSVLLLYATNSWSFLQSLACWILYQEGFIEPELTSDKPYDILLHQTLSVVKQNAGVKRNELSSQMHTNFAFKNISIGEIDEIIDGLLKVDLLELVERDLIIGIEGEKVVNSRDFYSMFKSEPNFKVINAGKAIGELPYSPQIKVDENILLAATIWKIVDVDERSKKIEVITAKDGKNPLFFGTGGTIHPRIRQKMLENLFVTNEYSELDKASSEKLQELRKDFSCFEIKDFDKQRPVLYKDGQAIVFTFQGTKVNRSLDFLLRLSGMPYSYDEFGSKFVFETSQTGIQPLFEQVKLLLGDLDIHLENALRKNPAILDFSKWGEYLPIKFQIVILKEKYFDFENLKSFLTNLELIASISRTAE